MNYTQRQNIVNRYIARDQFILACLQRKIGYCRMRIRLRSNYVSRNDIPYFERHYDIFGSLKPEL